MSASWRRFEVALRKVLSVSKEELARRLVRAQRDAVRLRPGPTPKTRRRKR